MRTNRLKRLHRLIALSTALVLTPGLARAQSFGLLGGVTRSFTSTSFSSGEVRESRAEGYRSDYTIGFFSSRRLAGPLRAEVDPMLVTKGDDQNGAGLTIRYLDLPVLAHWNVDGGSEKNTGRFFLSAGPAFNTVVSCDVELGGFSCNDAPFRTRRFELAGVVGVGAEIASPDGTSIGFDARYEQSLTNTGVENNGGKRVNHTLLLLLRLGLD